MPEDNSISVVNLGALSKPADTLIKKVYNALGGAFAPYQIKRVAKAEAEAAIIKAESEIAITDLQRRAMHRFFDEEAKRQHNIETITEKAIPRLVDNSSPEAVEDDWITNFFDKSRIVSDSKMQDLWSRVLAGEANSPGSYSKKTINLMGDLDKSDAELFMKLCSYGWIIGNFTPLIFDTQAKIYNDNGINFDSVSHLESLGLVQFESLSGYNRQKLPKNFTVLYCGKPLRLTMPNDTDNALTIGKVLLTRAGRELANICESPGIPEFQEYVESQWKDFLPKQETEQDVSPIA
jgi:hypothetical protein